jgi:hypothetical protein
MKILSPSGDSSERRDPWKVHFPALGLEGGMSSARTPRAWGLRGPDVEPRRGAAPRVGVRWHRPSRTRVGSPLVTPRLPARAPGLAARPGAPGVGRAPGRCAPRPAPVPTAAPRVKVKVSGPAEVKDWGAGPARTRERALGTGGAMDGLGRRLRASLRLKRGHGGQCPPG